MSSSGGGLSRRRVGAGGAGAGSGMVSDDVSSVPGTPTPPSSYMSPSSSSRSLNDRSGGGSRPGSRLGSGSGANGTGGSRGGGTSAIAGSRKVAYDPRDLNDEGEARESPKLTLMEEVLLLGLKDKQGYLSFWNDNISYTLRGCILIELALRRRIGMVKDNARRRFALQDRLIEVIDDRNTNEIILDEALKMMKMSEKMSVNSWIDLMSGETWNVMKIGYQLKQVRERLAKGLVDKGVLRTEKRNFLLFDMATHPVSDTSYKDAVLRRALSLLTSRSPAVHPGQFYKEEGPGVQFRVTRALCMVCASYAANVLENALTHLSYEAREAAFAKCDEFLAEFGQWPFPRVAGTGRTEVGAGSTVDPAGDLAGAGMGASMAEVARAVKTEMGERNDDQFEIIAAVLCVMSKMDSLL